VRRNLENEFPMFRGPLFLLIEMKSGFLVAEGRVELSLISPIY